MAEFHKPWAYYEFLGIPRDASQEQIKEAYKRLSLKYHPDRAGGDTQRCQTLNQIFEVLGDDGGVLGTEHSRRKHYDTVSNFDGFFDGYIVHGKERTQKLSEILLINLEIDKMLAEEKHKVSERFPEYCTLLDNLQQAEDSDIRFDILNQLLGISARAKGVPEEKIAEMEKFRREQRKRNEEETAKLEQELKSNPVNYSVKVLDVLYTGGGRFTFGTLPTLMKFDLSSQEVGKNVIKLVIGNKDDANRFSSPYLAGFQQVHFKSPKADVVVTDPHLVGIMHVIEGTVDVEYDGSSYGEVIRVMAPKVSYDSRFTRRDNLFVPARFATQNWWKKKPALDIRVGNGSIKLALKSERIARRNYDPYGLIFDNYIKNNLSDNLIYNKKENINKIKY
ncbi:MAG: J domain-containing protein [Nanoarchaeota archaeon]|nr:J domain-containing protein [Nanoarchaeota archaeon]MBU1632592.1 J domain-containing protein [Nanoarchaeota archaeon]MBU1876113.1 J domain-containing protein [Nanoarchaeota archaeon]